MREIKKNLLADVHIRLFETDVAVLKKIALERGSKWQIELRQLVRRALKGERRELLVLKEHE